MIDKSTETARELARRFTLLRTRDFERYDVPRSDLSELVTAGIWERAGRGLYRSALLDPSPHQSLLEVGQKCPHAVICTLSALRFHELTTETPTDVWVAVPRDARAPRVEHLSIQAMRFSGAMYSHGIEEHEISGTVLRVYSIPKTVVDCFRFRNRLGIDVAIEALEDAWRQKKVTATELWKHAKMAHLDRVMRPYLEVVLR